jgi:MFS family permease
MVALTRSANPSPSQSLIWSLAAAGKFFEGLVVFMTGIALPLIARQFHITAGQDGIVSAATLLGILIGAVGLGGLSEFRRPSYSRSYSRPSASKRCCSSSSRPR